MGSERLSAETTEKPERDATLREQRAHAKTAIGRLDHADAEKHLRAALVRAEEIALPEDERGTIRLELATVLTAQRQFAEAAKLQNDELARASAASGAESLDAGNAIYEIGERLLAEGEHVRARGHFVRAFQIARSADDMGAGASLWILALRAVGRLDWDLGEDRASAAKSIAAAYDRARRLAKPTHPLTASLALHPAIAVMLAGDEPKKAQVDQELDRFFDFRRAEKEFPGAAPAAEAQRHSEGIAMLRRGDFPGGETAIRDAVRGIEAILGPTHLHVLVRLAHLAAAHFANGRDLEGDALWERVRVEMAVHTLDAVLGVDEDAAKIARLYRERGNLDEAEKTFAQAIRLGELALGKDAPTLPKILEEHAEVLDLLGRAEDAAKARARARQIRARFRK